MSGYKNFAVVGAGNIGLPLIEALLDAKSSGAVDKVVVLARPATASKLDGLKSRGAAVFPVEDYSSIPDVSKALTGIDVVISTLNHGALNLQAPIAKAAKASGVQLFVPSEFGMATDGAKEGLLGGKNTADEQIRAVGLPTARFFNGGFSDWLWIPYIGLDVKSGSVEVGGDGNAKLSFTSRPDVGRYVVYVLTTLPPAETSNKIFRIEAERASFKEVFAAYEKKYGTKVQIKYTPVEELGENLKKDAHDVKSALHFAWANGFGTVGSPLDNDLFPGWNPKPVIDYL